MDKAQLIEAIATHSKLTKADAGKIFLGPFAVGATYYDVLETFFLQASTVPVVLTPTSDGKVQLKAAVNAAVLVPADPLTVLFNQYGYLPPNFLVAVMTILATGTSEITMDGACASSGDTVHWDIEVDCVGSFITVTPDPLDFGNVPATTPKVLPIVLNADGEFANLIISFTGTDPAQFRYGLTDTGPWLTFETISPNSDNRIIDNTLYIKFEPAGAGAYFANIHCAQGALVVDFPVTGTGV